MQVTASAPGKAILFGEHAVVYGKPAIAIALDRRTCVRILKREDDKIHIEIRDLGISKYLDFFNGSIECDTNEIGILEYILKSIKKLHTDSGLEVLVDVNIPVGAGLGSSAAVTVATIAALSKFNDLELSKEQMAKYAHEVEMEVQKTASPVDTAISTYGGVVYLSENTQETVPLDIGSEIPLVVGYTDRHGNTGKLVESVRIKRENYPEVLNPIIDSIGIITRKAKEALLNKEENKIGELMNMNHGLLDALGVNTKELSEMAYLARNAGALGSKITGAGGGGSIIAYCPHRMIEVTYALKTVENAFEARVSKKGVHVTVKKY
jgi:mevalonate kinase